MKKLIYLEDAIEAICKKCKADYPDTTACDICDDIFILKSLPSIESEIIRCKDCEWWEKQKDSLQGRCALMQMYPTGQWFCGNAQERRTNE